MDRRTFVGAAATAASAARVHGASDRIRLALIGAGSRGNLLRTWATQAGGIAWVGVCDAWDKRRDETASRMEGRPETCGDYRRVLDRKDVDAVIVATPDHLHSTITVDACRAGKDVYVEKPMTSLPMQGHEIVRAVGETKRVVQVGVQQRSMPHFIEAKQRFFDSGLIGRVHMVRTIWNANRGYLTPVPAGMDEKPSGLDWEACLGWLPKRPWDPKLYFNRFAYWDFSTGGQTGGLFVHMVDVVHWYLGLTRPKSAVALGGIYQYEDGRDTPDNINAVLDYPQRINVTFEASITDMVAKQAADIVFMGTGGRLHIFRGGYRFIPAENGAPEITAPGTPEGAHMKNWIDCIRSRKEPNATAVDGHYGAMACHVLNLAYQKKALVEWDACWDV
jgi:predicted dehydrogenase